MRLLRLSVMLWLIVWFQAFALAAAGSVAQSINLVIVALVVVSTRSSDKQLLWLAWWAGLGLDLATPLWFGWHMLWLLAWAVGLIMLERSGLMLKTRLMTAIVIFGSCLIYDLSLALALSVDAKHLWPIFNYAPIWLTGALLAALVGWLMPPPPLNYLTNRRKAA